VTEPFWRRLALAVALAAYAWWVSGVPHFTLAALVAVEVPGLLVVAAARRRGGPRRHRSVRRGLAPWVAVLGALAGWELLAYSFDPRAAHPTLSSMADAALRPRPLEATAFLAWLALGWRLARP
jgi:hypothetical protein